MVLEADAALNGVAAVLTFGKNKYARGNWKKGLSYNCCVDSLLRHLTAFQNGENLDRESLLPHVDHILCNALFLSQMYHTRSDMDDRVINTPHKPEVTESWPEYKMTIMGTTHAG